MILEKNLTKFLIKYSVNVQLLSDELINFYFEAIKRRIEKQLTSTFSSEENKIIKSHLWHAFSQGITESEKGPIAIENFCRQYLKEFVILIPNSRYLSIQCKLLGNPILGIELFKTLKMSLKKEDLYILHSNFNWLYVMTHEADFGPYYTNLKN